MLARLPCVPSSCCSVLLCYAICSCRRTLHSLVPHSSAAAAAVTSVGVMTTQWWSFFFVSNRIQYGTIEQWKGWCGSRLDHQAPGCCITRPFPPPPQLLVGQALPLSTSEAARNGWQPPASVNGYPSPQTPRPRTRNTYQTFPIQLPTQRLTPTPRARLARCGERLPRADKTKLPTSPDNAIVRVRSAGLWRTHKPLADQERIRILCNQKCVHTFVTPHNDGIITSLLHHPLGCWFRVTPTQEP